MKPIAIKLYFVLLILFPSMAFCQRTSVAPANAAAFSRASTVATNVVELKLPKAEKIVLKLMYRNGSVSDPSGREGLTYLTANTVIEGGTQTMSSSQVKDFLYPIAASFYVSVDKEVTVFTFEFHKDHLEKVYPVIKSLIQAPLFAEEDFSRVKSNQQNYVDEVVKTSSDEEYSKKALEDFMFAGTPYRHMVQGKSAGIKAITLADVKKHYKDVFTGLNVLIGIAGNYDATFVSRAKADFGAENNDKFFAAPRIRYRAPEGIEVNIIAKPGALGSAVFTGAPLAITRSSDDFAALMVANSWLGEHRKSYSRLYQKIREARSMNYGDYSYIEWYNNGGQNMLPQPGCPRATNYFSIWLRPVQTAAGLKKQYTELSGINIGHAHFALRMAIREMDLMIQNGMTQEDFELTRTFLRSYIKLYVQTPSRQLGFLMDSRFYGRQNYISEMDALLAKLTLTDVNAAIKKYWTPQNMYVTIVTDDTEAKPLMESLLGNASSPMSYSDVLKKVLPETIHKEDDVVSGYKLNVTKANVQMSEEVFNN